LRFLPGYLLPIDFSLFGGGMSPSHPFTLDAAQWGVLVFVVATTFFSGLLGGFFFGMTHALRRGESGERSKSIWTFEDEI